MKWHIPQRDPKPKVGDRRQRVAFAWFPTLMTDKVTKVWLERYRVSEKFVKCWGTLGPGGPPDLGLVELVDWKVTKSQPLSKSKRRS